MAKSISKTPVFEGEDANALLKKMQEPPTKKDKEFAKKNTQTTNRSILN